MKKKAKKFIEGCDYLFTDKQKQEIIKDSEKRYYKHRKDNIKRKTK